MDYAKTKYLFRTKLESRLKKQGYLVLDRLTKERCPICLKWRYDLDAHFRDAHVQEVAT